MGLIPRIVAAGLFLIQKSPDSGFSKRGSSRVCVIRSPYPELAQLPSHPFRTIGIEADVEVGFRISQTKAGRADQVLQV